MDKDEKRLKKDDELQWALDKRAIKELEQQGHTFHCAARQVWGDGECECRKGLTK